MSTTDLKSKIARRLATELQKVSQRPMRFNEAVDEENRVIFVAVPKTGTTSIRSQMLRDDVDYMVTEPHLNIREIKDGLRFYALLGGLHDNRDYPCDTQKHRSYAEIVRDHEAFFDACFKFGSVRNPWARVVSLYSRREGMRLSDEIAFDEFCLQLRFASDTCNIPTRHDCQIDWLIDDSGTLMVDHVMRLEEVAEEIKLIQDLSEGRAKFETLFANTNPNSKSRDYRDLYSVEAREHVSKIFARDIDAFGYSF